MTDDGAAAVTEPEVVALFDRFLQLVGDATRRFSRLFPYNHLCRRLQAMLGSSVARVDVCDDEGAILTTVWVIWRDGEFRRAGPRQPEIAAWTVPYARLEDAAKEPWAYLADPKRLGFAWFDDLGTPWTLRRLGSGGRHPAVLA